MRLNVKAVDKNGRKVYHSYDFEGYEKFYISTNLYDKTKRLMYGGDTVEYKNNLYQVCIGEFKTKEGFKNVGWHLKPINKDTNSVPINSDILNKIKVVEINNDIDGREE